MASKNRIQAEYPVKQPIYSIILAGGSGTRMGAADRHKVCFDIDGRPAIVRSLDTYTAAGICPNIIVVGALAGQVMETLSRARHDAIYAYQADQRGTGHAAKQGARLLEQIGYNGLVLVVAGDVMVQPVALQKLLKEFESSSCDLALMAGRREHAPTAGRVVTDEAGNALTIVEVRDIGQRHALSAVRNAALAQAADDASYTARLRETALEILKRQIPDERKARLAFGELWDYLHDVDRKFSATDLLSRVTEEDTRFQLYDALGKSFVVTSDEVDQLPWINLSVYLCKAPALYYALNRLTDNNAQREEYLTDIVPILSQAKAQGEGDFRVKVVSIDHPKHVMGFNTLEELINIEKYYVDQVVGKR